MALSIGLVLGGFRRGGLNKLTGERAGLISPIIKTIFFLILTPFSCLKFNVSIKLYLYLPNIINFQQNTYYKELHNIF